ncbi:MAG TPA: hypothetical protein VE422_24095, partial [Terriglobia bacterium]|nr:hypothetical protein [Terriglobia bacterium]
MLQKRMFVLLIVAALSLAMIGPAAGGQRGAAALDPVKTAIQIKPNLWYIADGGANSVVEVTPEGLILGDTKNPGAEIEAAFIAEIKSISPLPVKYVFNTHPHGD